MRIVINLKYSSEIFSQIKNRIQIFVHRERVQDKRHENI